MKTILFVDPPAFCTTVEALDDPALRRRPVVIAPLAADRAVLLAVSAEARHEGLARGMPVTLARRLCPDVIVRPPNPRRYAEAHRALHRILAGVAPVIEPRNWGHSYLDITGTDRLFGPPLDVARRLEREVRERLSLRLVVGVAINKLVSEAAATVAKRDPRAEVWPVDAGHEAHFLAPEPVAMLPDVPAKIRERLDDYHLERIGEVAAIGEQPLRAAFGAPGRTLHIHAHGIDLRPVLPPDVKAACRVTHLLATDTNDRPVLHALLRPLAERLGRRLRTRGLTAGRLLVLVRYVDDETAQRAIRLPPYALDADLWRGACRALDDALARRTAVRSLALIADALHDGQGQMELWPDPVAEARPKEAALQRALDAVRGAVSSPLQHDFAERRVAREQLVSLARPHHRHDPLHDRPQHTTPELRQHLGGEARDQVGPLLGAARPHHGADHLEPLPQHDAKIDPRRLRPRERPKHDHPAAPRQQGQVLRQRLGAEHVDDDVDRLADLGDPVRRAGEDAVRHAEARAPRQLVGSP